MERYLANGMEIELKGIDGRYIIKDIIGRGSSCIVYSADFYNSNNEKTEHLLKEFNPRCIDLKRDARGLTPAKEDEKELFESLCNRFKEGIERQSALRTIPELKNYTANIQNTYYDNGTIYIDMTETNGKSYADVEEKSIYNLAQRIKVLAQVIGNYHKHGYLHLDIKPSNIFVRPEDETCQDVLLFDFDSLVPFSEDNGKCVIGENVSVSYTTEYAPIELLTVSRRGRICKATDIYEIGEIFFEKLMGRHSTALEHNAWSDYEYNRSAQIFGNVNPKVIPLLNELFTHTLCNDVNMRYQSTDELIEILDKIIKIADTEKPYVCNNFSYQSANFTGRKKELKSIDDFFSNRLEEKGNVLFLSGLGGIGKTEIAKRYAFENKTDFDRVVFLTYNQSVQETICQDEIKIHAKEFDTKNNNKFYKEKMDFIKTDLTERDLIIFDNFDRYDEQIEDLFELNCKILVTTRLDFSDGDYPQLDIGEFEEFDELRKLFNQYNSFEYSNSERLSIDELLHFVDCHTMTICLIAKYLKNSHDMPSSLLKSFKSREGITNTESKVSVLHKKDKKLRGENVTSHLLTLFNLNSFSSKEKELLCSISLLGSIRMRKETLANVFENIYNETVISSLINRGWVEEEKEISAISLHQIILDLIYNELGVDRHISKIAIEDIVSYLDKNEGTAAGKRIIATNVSERVACSDVLTAKLYYQCYRFLKQQELLEKATNLCNEFCDNESQNLLLDIYKYQILEVGRNYENSLWVAEDDNNLADELNDSVCKLTHSAWRIIIELASSDAVKIKTGTCSASEMPDAEICSELDNMKFACFMEMYGAIPQNAIIGTDIIDKITSLCDILDRTASSVCSVEVELEKDSGAYNLYLLEICMLRYAYYLAVTTKQNIQYVENILTKISEFYDESYTDFARSACFADPEKAAYYSKIIINNRTKQDPNIIHIGGKSYYDAAFDAKIKEEYEKSNKLLKKALESQEAALDDIYYQMAENYTQMKQYDSAIDMLKKVFEYDVSNELSTISTMMKIANVHSICGDNKSAIEWYERVINENITSFDSLSSYQKVDVMISVVKKLELEENDSVGNEYSCWLLNSVNSIDENDTTQEEMLPVYRCIFQYLKDTKGMLVAGEYIMNIADKCSLHYSSNKLAISLYEFVYKNTKEISNVNLLFEALIKSISVCLDNNIDGDYDTLLSQAKQIFESSTDITDLNAARYYRLMANYFYNVRIWENPPMLNYDEVEKEEKMFREKCDYFLLATHEEKFAEDFKSKLELWDKAYDEYMTIGDLKGTQKCCIAWEEIYFSSLGKNQEKYMLLEHYIKIFDPFVKFGDINSKLSFLEKIYLLWDVEDATNREDYCIKCSIELVTKELIDMNFFEMAIYIGLLKVVKDVLPDEFLSFYERKKLTDLTQIDKKIDLILQQLPEQCDSSISNIVLETLETISPIYEKLYPDNKCRISKIIEKYLFQDIDVKP